MKGRQSHHRLGVSARKGTRCWNAQQLRLPQQRIRVAQLTFADDFGKTLLNNWNLPIAQPIDFLCVDIAADDGVPNVSKARPSGQAHIPDTHDSDCRLVTHYSIFYRSTLSLQHQHVRCRRLTIKLGSKA